jgi:dTDP-4-amino-4,6-dideoxygalactose transaminase
MRDDFLVFGAPLIGEAEINEVVDSLRSGWIGTGPKVARFERMLAEYVGTAHGRCVSSCTAALFLAMRCLDLGPGDEVLVPALTFVATANAVEHTGATPILIDSEPTGTGLMDLDAAEAAITERTRAIVPVHLYGRPFDMDRLNTLRDKYGLAVVEDAAHALGAQWNGTQIGAFGNLTAYSFYPTKNITTIEGGAILTDNLAIATRVEQLALHGLSAGAWKRFSDDGFKHYGAVEVGYKLNMTDVQASLGIHQLPHLDEWIDIRREQAGRYDAMLGHLPLTTPPPTDPQARHAHHLYTVLVDRDAAVNRDDVLRTLTEQRVGAGVHYQAIHLHPYYASRYEVDPGALPVANDISARTLSLPFGPKVSEQDMEDVAEALSVAFGA